MECGRSAHADLEDYSRKRATRRVALDLTVSLAGRLYEAPVPLISKQIILLDHDHDHGPAYRPYWTVSPTVCPGRWTSHRQMQGQARPPVAALEIQRYHNLHWRLPF
ncbi:hypothetical protein DFAR_3710031 [Desulfarculales bacterium]